MDYKEMYETLLQENKQQQIQIQNLKLQLQSLKRMIFGAKREKIQKEAEIVDCAEQCTLFEDATEKSEKELDREVATEIEEKTEEEIIYTKKKKKRKGGIKRSRLNDIEIKKEEYVINEEEEKCPICKSKLTLVGKKVVREEIEYRPAKLIIKSHIQNIYKCTECGTKDSEKETSTFVEPKVTRAILAHSFASPSLITEVMYKKYYLGVPLYRQEKVWDDMGMVLPRNMMANWMIKTSEYYLEPLYKLMFKTLKKENEVCHSDETTIQVHKEEGRTASSNSYMWVYASGELEKKQGVIFHYNPSRSGETAQKFLNDFNKILVTDGYSGYNSIDCEMHAECWSHCRRYFYESIPIDKEGKMDTNCYGHKAIYDYIDKLFKIEREIADLSVEEKVKERQKGSKEILDEFFQWVNSVLTEKIIVNDKLKKALTYASNQQKELSEFLKDGRIPLTNNRAEHSIRPFAVHRKNWLFADSVAGAEANAVIYSIIESAKANKLNIYKYITYLLKEIPQLDNPSDEIKITKYLPWSKELPKEILNYQGTYEELKADSNLIVEK